jgi:hypothetical protein
LSSLAFLLGARPDLCIFVLMAAIADHGDGGVFDFGHQRALAS